MAGSDGSEVRRAPATIPTAAAAVRRSLLLWGLGHLALGERRRGISLAAAEVIAVAILAWAGPSLAEGSWAVAVLVGGLGFLVAWALVALDAYRRTARMRASTGLPGPDGGALQLLWLAPVAIAGTILLWGTGGLGRPETTLARYVDDWQAGIRAAGGPGITPIPDGLRRAAADAADLFLVRRPAGLALAWERQTARLTNELVRAAGAAGPAGGIDPYRPFESVRFEEVSAGTGADAARAADGELVTVALRIVRRQAVHGTFAGLLPTSSQTLVPVTDLGTVTLRRVERPSGRFLVPASGVWLIERVDLVGESLP